MIAVGIQKVGSVSFRSCLIELKSFFLSKFGVDPMHRVLMFLPLLLMVPCKTRCFQVKFVRISVFFVHGTHRREEYRLSFAQNLSSRYQSWVRDGVGIGCTSDVMNVLEEIVRNYYIVL